jgi:hypothetical protein
MIGRVRSGCRLPADRSGWPTMGQSSRLSIPVGCRSMLLDEQGPGLERRMHASQAVNRVALVRRALGGLALGDLECGCQVCGGVAADPYVEG